MCCSSFSLCTACALALACPATFACIQCQRFLVVNTTVWSRDGHIPSEDVKAASHQALPILLHACTRHALHAGESWVLGWKLGTASTAETQAHVVELACTPAHDTDLDAFRAAQASAAEVQWGTKDECIQGARITAVGSPFGVMSPEHFTNTCVHGVISNYCTARGVHGNDSGNGLLMADLHCLPGMEGGPVFNEQGQLVAVTMLPLLSRTFHAEVIL